MLISGFILNVTIQILETDEIQYQNHPRKPTA